MTYHIEKSIKGYEKTYVIRSDGIVFNMKHDRFLSAQIDHQGYVYYQLYKNSSRKIFYAHRLVAEYFIVKSRKKLEVNHKNGIKTDNRIENLEWISHLENIKHALLNGFYQKRKTSKLNKEDIPQIKSLYKKGRNQYEIANIFSVSQGLISEIINNNKWSYVI